MRELSGPVEFDTSPEGPDPTSPTGFATKEYTDAADSAVTTSVTVETTRAEAAESTNATGISTETTRAEAAETANATGVSTERTRAQTAEGTNATAISAEISRAETAETANATAISAVSSAAVPSLAATKSVYVTTTGNDANSGLTWGLAKATVGGALTALGITGSGNTQINTPGIVLLGPGSFTDLNSHLIQSALGLEIIGAGRELTHVQGPDALPWVSFRNSYRCRIKNLTYTGSPSGTGWGAESTSWWSGSAWYGSGLSCEQNGAENVNFGNGANSCAYGWRWRCGAGGSASNDPHSDANNDSGVLIGCLFNGCALPVTIEHSNSLLHEIRNCSFSNTGSGITFNGGSAVLSHCSVGTGTTANGGSGWFIDLQPAFGTWNGAAAADYQHQIDVLGTSYESNLGYVRSNSGAAGALGGILRVRFTGGELTGQPTLTGNVGVDWENTDEGVLTFTNMTLGSGSSGGVTLGSSAHPSSAASNITFDDCDVEFSAFYYNGNLLLNQWRNKWSNPTFTGAAANLTAIPYMSGPVAPFLYANTAAGGTNGATVTTANSGGASGNPWGNASIGSGCTLTYDNTHTFQGAGEAYLFNTAANASAFTAWLLPVATNVYASCWLFFSSTTANLQTNIISFTGGLGAGTSVAINTNGTVRVATANGSTANSVTVLATGVGYTLSAHFTIAAGTSQTTLNIYNSAGTLLETVSTTATGTTPTPTEIYWGSSGAGSSTVNTYWLGAIQASSAPLLATGALANVNTTPGVIQATGTASAAGASGLLADAGHVHLTDVNSLALTGTPTAPTASAGTNSTQLATTAFAAALVTTFSPMNYGAAGNGTADDTLPVKAAFSAAAAVGGVVDLGHYSFKTTSPIVMPTGITIRGAQAQNSGANLGGYLHNTVTDLFSITGSIGQVHIENCALLAYAGYVFNCAPNAGVTSWLINNSVITQLGDSFGIFNMPNGTYIGNTLRDCYINIGGAYSSSPWSIISWTNAVNCNYFENLVLVGNGVLAPFFYLANASAHGYNSNNVFRNIDAELCPYGVVEALTTDRLLVESVMVYDTATFSGSVFTTGACPAIAGRTDTGVTTTTGSSVVGDASATGIEYGYSVTGTGIPANTYIVTATAGVGFTLSANATASGTITAVVGGGPGGLHSQNITLRDSGRAGGVLGGGTYDVQCGSSDTSIVLQNVGGQSGSPSYNVPATQTTIIGSGVITAPVLSAAGLNAGASVSSRYVGGVSGAHPATGTFLAGDWALDISTPTLWVCVTGGTPGTWVALPSIDTTATDIQPAGTIAAGSSGLAADARHVHPRPGGLWTPSDSSLVAANGDLRSASGVLTLIAGTIYLFRINVFTSTTVSLVNFIVNTPSSGTGSNSYTGIYSSSGTQLSVSSDFTTTALVSGGPSTITVGSTSLTAGSFYYVALLVNATTTQAHLYGFGMPASNINFGSSLSQASFVTNGTLQTSLPSSLSLASNSNSGSLAVWTGVK